MTASRTAARRPGQRAELTRERIVSTATRLAADEGFERVTIRRLCELLEVTPAAVYWHIENKDELLREVLETVLSQVPRPDPASGTWLDQLLAFYASVREVFRAHPGISTAMLSQPFGTAATLDQCAYVLGLLRDGGFDDATAASLYIGLSTFTAGHVLFADGARTSPTGHAEVLAARIADALAARPDLRGFDEVLGAFDREQVLYLETIERIVRGAAPPSTTRRRRRDR